MRSSSETRYFKHLFDRCAEALASIFNENKHADKVIEYYFRNNKKWGKRDRHFFAETIYECVRWWNQLAFLALGKTEPQSLEDIHRIIAAFFLKTEKDLPEWYEKYDREIQNRLAIPLARHLQFAVPEWLYLRGKEELGEVQWHEALNHLNTPAKVVLRVNTLKISRRDFLRECAREEFHVDEKPLPQAPDAVVMTQRKNIFASQLFQKGLCEVQDSSSQQVAPFLSPQPGDRVIDACAGAGGKSLHIAALMENKGKIISLDIHEWKLQELQKRARRDGVHCIETRAITSSKVIKRLKQTADSVLMDVPCSGLGVLKRNPDTKWKMSPQRLEDLHRLQKEIIHDYSQMVKPGGYFVYSTCSIFPSENSGIVQDFLKSQPQWNLVEDRSLLPSDDGDGFYMARLQHRI
ncbi:MAG: methyltransferase domain-containing protein [Bdellovibrionales bacterium]|nr:methyltransferase domain-containing protein [Bdellovibrionales bacterium]